MSWHADSVTFRYPGAVRDAVHEITTVIPAGRCTAVLGPNGSGKSTFLRLLLGTLAPARGGVMLEERPLGDWARREIALRVGVVQQLEEITFPVTVRELVSMGRYPHLGALRAERPLDRDAVSEAMRRCDVMEMADRPVTTLSGGERQRARLARALAQQPAILALDEPTIALDIRHEMEIFELLRDLVGSGVTVLLVTHNLNLAARYADRLLLLDEGRLAAEGAPSEVLRGDLLREVYRWPLSTTTHPGPGRDTGAVQITPLARATPESR